MSYLGSKRPVPSVDSQRRERRQSFRKPVCIECHLDVGGGSEQVEALTDLSVHGAWVETLKPLPHGAQVTLRFSPPGTYRGEVVARARVTRSSPGRRQRDRGPIGMGLCFEGLDGSEQAQIASGLARLGRLPFGA